MSRAPTTSSRRAAQRVSRRGSRRDTSAGEWRRCESATTPRRASLLRVRRARASCAIDLSGRPFTLFAAELPPGSTGGFDHELTEEFFRAFANAAKLTLHVRIEAGSNAHHMIEAAYKAFARALREAIAIDPSEQGVPSTKGTLTS